MHSGSACCALAIVVTGFFTHTLLADTGQTATHTDRPSSLSRLVRHFDFEEAERAPYEMPLNFYRYGVDDGGIAHGFPPFGTMRLTNEAAYSGNWSFKFDLDGGSMAARIPTAVIPIMPGADYHIATRVMTEGLTHARARLVAWLYDANGRIIPGSRSESRLINTEGKWQVIATPVRGRFEHATDLGIELQLLQPAQFSYNHSDPYRPVHADVSGQAYFDDVSVWQQPRIKLSTNQPGNVIVSPERPRVLIEVHDVIHKRLDAHLRVYDLHGNTVFDDSFRAPRSPQYRAIDLPFERYGWYRASLDILLDCDLAAQHWVDFVYLPRSHRVGIGQHHRFTLTLPDSWQQHDDVLPHLIQRLGVGGAIMPVLSRSMTKQHARAWYERARSTIENLRSEHIELAFSLDSIPDELTRDLDLDPEEVLFALEREEAIWRDYLDDLIVNYSFEVSRWQIGRSGGDAASWLDHAAQRIDRTAIALRRLVPGGTVLVPTAAHRVATPIGEHAAYHVTLPYHAHPTGIESYVALWLNEERRDEAFSTVSRVDPQDARYDIDRPDMLMEIEPAPIGMYSQYQRATDLMLRVLHAWRAGAVNLSIRPPWTTTSGGGTDVMPRETFAVWQQLIDQLRGRRVVGALAIGQGMHCWLLAGVDRDDAALVVWKEPGTRNHEYGGSTGPEAVFELQLAAGPVSVTDGFGNRQSVPLLGEVHTIRLEQMPRFIEGINLELVQFRGGFSLDPAFIPVESRVHEHELVLRNPWPMPIGGTIRLRDIDGFTFTPRSHRFSIPSHGEVRLPVEIQIARGIMAGIKRIKADVTLSADGQYDLMMFKDVTLGLEHIEFAATSRSYFNPETGHNDLIITHYITNTGRHPMNIEAFMLGDGVPHERRLIAGLDPSEVAIRVFMIPDGANRLAGQRIRVGVIERDGVGRLNQVIEVPER